MLRYTELLSLKHVEKMAILERELDIGRTAAFDRMVADLPRRWRDDGLDVTEGTWEALSDDRKLAYFAEHAAVQPVSFMRLADAAVRTLGRTPEQDLTSDEVGYLLHYRAALERHRSGSKPAEMSPPAEMEAFTMASEPHLPSPADLVERNSVASQQQTDKRSADLVERAGPPSPKPNGGRTPRHRL